MSLSIQSQVMALHFTQSKSHTLYSRLHDHLRSPHFSSLLFSLLLLLQPHWLHICQAHACPGPLHQLFICLECSFPSYQHGSLLTFLKICLSCHLFNETYPDHTTKFESHYPLAIQSPSLFSYFFPFLQSTYQHLLYCLIIYFVYCLWSVFSHQKVSSTKAGIFVSFVHTVGIQWLNAEPWRQQSRVME